MFCAKNQSSFCLIKFEIKTLIDEANLMFIHEIWNKREKKSSIEIRAELCFIVLIINEIHSLKL